MELSPSSLCPHFGVCGGCLWQDLDSSTYLARKRERVITALKNHGLAGEVAAVEPVAPLSRRRARLKAEKQADRVRIGFHARASHALVDMTVCRILEPGLFACVCGLRERLGQVLRNGDKIELYLAACANGIDLSLTGPLTQTPAVTAAFARWSGPLGLARITLNGRLALLLDTPRIALGKAFISPPPEAFLQPTRAGEARLQDLVRDGLGKAKHVADLFAGCGTFTFSAAERAKVHAVESDRTALEALIAGARHGQGLKPITGEVRNLDRLPLAPVELNRFDGVILDPPRAGALPQVESLGTSTLKRVVYVSCNPASFARDARRLLASGFSMGVVQPVDQFLWSDHIETVTVFTRR
jgi:23S rRNA (uracil1939-C5)-methyltransferase